MSTVAQFQVQLDVKEILRIDEKHRLAGFCVVN